MIEEFDYTGVWWLPNKPEEKISGTFRFAPHEGAILDLIGSFKDIKDMDRILEPEIILGISSNGKGITLHRCVETKSSLSFPGLLTSSFYAVVVFIGTHFQKTEDIKFKSLTVRYSHLDEWVNISGFDIRHDRDEAAIKYKVPEAIEASINNDYRVFIDIRATYPTLSIVQQEASIKQKTYIRIVPSEEKPLDQYLNIMYHIQNFLSLGIMEPVYPLVIEGITEMNKEMIKDRAYYPPVEISYKLPDIPKASKTLLPFFDMLFTFKDISDRFEYFLKNWFKKVELLGPVYDLYFGTLYNPHMYLQHRFLNLIQAIESYHRRVMKNYELPEKEHNERIKEILDAIPQKYKKWLSYKLGKYSNEPDLGRRLGEILGKCPEIVNSLIADKNNFVQKVVVTRNYLTHYDSSLKERAAEGEELYHVTQKLKTLLEMCLLTELGFDFNDIKNLFLKNRRYKYELHT